MDILAYLSSNQFDFIDRVNFSCNNKVIRTVCFKRLTGRNISSGEITFFKVGTCSYDLKSVELGCKMTKEKTGKYMSLKNLDERIAYTFG